MRVRTGNLRRRRALHRVARAPLRIELLPAPEGTTQFAALRDELMRQIMDAMRLPSVIPTGVLRIDPHTGGYLPRRLPPLIPVEPRGEFVLPKGHPLAEIMSRTVVVPNMHNDELIVGYPDKPESAVKITNIGKTKP